MNRIVAAALVSTVVVSFAQITCAAVPSTTLIAQDPGKPLTLYGAKEQVQRWLNSVGQSTLRASEAEFDGQGNVKVDVKTFQGLPYTHVLVHGADQSITDARTGAVLRGRG